MISKVSAKSILCAGTSSRKKQTKALSYVAAIGPTISARLSAGGAVIRGRVTSGPWSSRFAGRKDWLYCAIYLSARHVEIAATRLKLTIYKCVPL